jgi:GMP synthase (glutamine-hydrolysing)
MPVDQETEKSVREISLQAGYTACVLPIRSVGVQGDSRTYAHPALVTGGRNWETLESLSTGMTNKIKGINRVIYGLRVEGRPEYRLVKAYLTRERLATLRTFDHLVTGALHTFGEYGTVWQMPVVLLPLVNKAGRQSAVLRPIMSQEAMTARFARLKDETLAYILEESKKIDGLGDLFYDVTNKPPGTIEWE